MKETTMQLYYSSKVWGQYDFSVFLKVLILTRAALFFFKIQ